MSKTKSIFTAVFATLSGWLGILAIPVIIMVFCNVFDYLTGLAASKYRGQTIDSYKGIQGIAKKICMWILVGIGAMTDQLLIYAGDTIGITLPFTYLIACIVALWLTLNEIISILENIRDIGVELPPFLLAITKNIKKQVEDKTSGIIEVEELKDEGGKMDD